MIVYLIKRLLSVALTFFIVSLVIFLMMHAVPGGPFTEKDMPLSEAVKAALNARLGLDKPLLVQYGEFMVQIAQGDLGRSLVTNRPISTDVAAVLLALVFPGTPLHPSASIAK